MESYTFGGEHRDCNVADISVIPVVVAKCGLYLKEHATEVEGAFRVSGSAKRMRELQAIFDTGPRVSHPVYISADSSTARTLIGRLSTSHHMTLLQYSGGESIGMPRLI